VSRFLLIGASMGSGHDAVTAELARRLGEAGHRTAEADVLDLLPGPVGPALRAFYRTAVRRAPALYAGIYAGFFRSGAGPRPGSAPLAALAEAALLDRTRRWRADAVVPVFHLAAQLTGRLRDRGALTVPSAVVVTDFAVHRQWLHPGNDLHLCLTPDLAERAHRGTGRRAAVCGPLVAPRFRPDPPGRDRWRRRLGPEGEGLVLLSAGAWGAGRGLRATARLLASAGYRPVVLCGRDARLRRSLARERGVGALGWTEEMPAVLAAARVLVDNAAGQTALQALACGVPVVGYRPIPGHGVEGVRTMARLGLTEFARDGWQLLQAMDRLVPDGPVRAGRVAAARPLFHAADVVPLLGSLVA
jgi:glycosyltransferase involved in cell wall biosynthesis